MQNHIIPSNPTTMNKTQRSKAPSQSALESSDTRNPLEVEEKRMKKDRTIEENKGGKKRYLGVRQRRSGRWVAEIKDSSKKLRVWLGTFDRAEEAALAYDSAAKLLRGRNARINFPYNEILETNEGKCKRNYLRIHQLLQQAIRKKLERSVSFDPFGVSYAGQNQTNQVGSFDYEALVQPDGSIGHCEFDQDRRNNICGPCFGNSKVYSSVIVAPSFSSFQLTKLEKVSLPSS